MNRQAIGVITAVLLLSISCPEPGVQAASHSAGKIVSTGQMIAARFDHAAVLLPSGRVLIIGGIERNGVMQPSAELFDPVSGRFTPTGKPQAQHGWGVTATLLQDGKVLVYKMKAENDKSSLHLTRKLSVDVVLLDVKYYPALRQFFQTVRKGDEEQVVLQAIGASASN